MLKVYVGVVTYNSLADLPSCFAGLRAQSFANLEIVVLDNASRDDSLEWVAANVPNTRLIRNTINVGFACAHNQIIAACNLQAGEYYMPLNPDVQLEPGYIAQLIKIITLNDAGWATGKLLLRDAKNYLYSAGHAVYRDGYALNIGYGLPDDSPFNQPREVFGAPGASPLISAVLINTLAVAGELFDRHMFLYGEDTDLDWRARRAGWRCWYTPEAVATHRGSHATEALRMQAIGNRYLSVIKNAFLIDLVLYNLPLIVMHCVARLILTPHMGFQLICQIVRFAPFMWRKRRHPQISRTVMQGWFRWSAAQPTMQPMSFSARLKASRNHAQG